VHYKELHKARDMLKIRKKILFFLPFAIASETCKISHKSLDKIQYSSSSSEEDHLLS
jgi:hypothetical protein